MLKHIDDNSVEDIMNILNALNDQTRQSIIMLFQSKKEYCVTDISDKFELSRPTISHHLNLMKRSKILKSSKKGKEVYYSFNKSFVIDNLKMLIQFLQSCC